jgi:hypothetical protein
MSDLVPPATATTVPQPRQAADPAAGIDPTADAALTALASRLDGSLTRAGDTGWDEVRIGWHLDVDQRPTAVVVAASERDVVETVTAAREAGLRVAAQATGHNAGPLGDLDGTVLLKLHELRDVQVDPGLATARVAAGAQWGDVVRAASPHGLAALAGSSHDVGVAGYTLGGGISWLARSHGLSSNSVTAIEVVTADGTLRRVDADHDPDLFWALRGGGGSFGVVTALEMKLFEVSQVHAGVLFFPIARAREVLQAWREWTQTVPETVMSVGRVLRFPLLPDLPPFLSGQSYVVVEAVCQMPADFADEVLEPLRELDPAIDTFAPTSMPELLQLHMDPPGPVPGRGDGALLATVTAETIDAILAVAGPDVESPLLSVEVRHLGGMLAAGRMPGGAVSGFDADYGLFTVGITPVPELVAVVEGAVDDVLEAVAPWASDGSYLNFAERPRSGDSLFGAEAHARLREVKKAYDPADVIRSNHPVEPA